MEKVICKNFFVFLMLFLINSIECDLFANWLESSRKKYYNSENSQEVIVDNVFDLIDAINNGNVGDKILIAEGVYNIPYSLKPKSGMTITGAGLSKTILKGISSWDPGTANLPDKERDHKSVDTTAYLINLQDNTQNVTISNLSLRGYKLHGAIYGNNCDGLQVYFVDIRNFLWSGIRTFRMSNSTIHDNLIMNVGEKFGSTVGGGVYHTWYSDSRMYNNRIVKTNPDKYFFGIKGRQVRRCKFYNNTIKTNSFSIEFAHENDADVEISYNYLDGGISIPKYGGGTIPESGITFNIHHNVFTNGYSLEWSRNGVKVHHNLFKAAVDTVNERRTLIANWTPFTDPGGTDFYNNLVKINGYGIYTGFHPYNNFKIYNNHFRVYSPVSQDLDARNLFRFPEGTDYSSIEIKSNIFEIYGKERGLMKIEESYESIIVNNEMIGVNDTDKYENPETQETSGIIDSLLFSCGAGNQYEVSNWSISRKKSSQYSNADKKIFNKKIESNILLLYPNPVDDIIFIDLPEFYNEMVEIEIVDLSGKRLRSYKNIYNAKKISYNISDLERGIYFLNVKTQNGSYTEKIQKN